jgi:hypothetical protein
MPLDAVSPADETRRDERRDERDKRETREREREKMPFTV